MSIRVSQSSLRAWRKCRKMFAYRYVEMLSPKGFIRPLEMGTAIHKAIEYNIAGKTLEAAMAKSKENRAKVFSSDVDAYDQMMVDTENIMTAYAKFHADEPITYFKIGHRSAEFEFKHDIGGGVILEGVIDCIPETEDGRRWVGEHKSHKVFPGDDVRQADLQSMLYADAAIKAFGIKRVVGVMWDYIRSKSPEEPKLLKNGTLSKARIDTLPVMYERAIERHQLDRADYVDVLGELDDKLKTWFRRVFVPLNRNAVSELMEETRVTGREMMRKAGVDTTRNLSRDCSYCSYERLCKAELFGMDADFIREREFIRKQAKVELE